MPPSCEHGHHRGSLGRDPGGATPWLGQYGCTLALASHLPATPSWPRLGQLDRLGAAMGLRWGPLVARRRYSGRRCTVQVGGRGPFFAAVRLMHATS